MASSVRGLRDQTNATLSGVRVEMLAGLNTEAAFEYGVSVDPLTDAAVRRDLQFEASNLRPAIQLTKGQPSTTISFDISGASSQKIQVLTAEGVHVLGSAMSQAQANQLMSLDAGFGDGSYSATYLNGIGETAAPQRVLPHSAGITIQCCVRVCVCAHVCITDYADWG